MGKARNFVYLQINKRLYQLSGADLFINLATFLRENLHLTATKIVCEEGDCGACSVLLGIPYKTNKGYSIQYQVVNSCIIPVFSLDSMHIITLEGLNKENLSAIQKAMAAKGGAQCGFCTPGMIISLVDFFEHKNNNCVSEEIVSQEIREKLKGNLCRCTGYQPIINAALSVTKDQYHRFSRDYATNRIAKKLFKKQQQAIIYESDEVSLWIPNHLDDALRIKKQQKNSQICAGMTDLAVLWNKGHWNKEKWNKTHLKKESMSHKNFLSLQKVPSLYLIKETKKKIKFGAQVSLQQIQDYLTEYDNASFKPGFKSFCELLARFGSPQVKNRATLTGNVANASPVGDTIPFLMVMKAKVELQQLDKYRLAKINTFFKGYKQLAIKDNEIITGIILPKLKKRQQCLLYKVSQRNDVDISCVSAAFLIKLSKSNKTKVKQIRIAFAGIAPYVIRLYEAEQIMLDRVLNQPLIEEAIAVTLSAIKPLSDIRGSEKFRRKLVENLFLKFYFEIHNSVLPSSVFKADC